MRFGMATKRAVQPAYQSPNRSNRGVERRAGVIDHAAPARRIGWQMLVRLQQHCRQRGRQGQRHDQRDHRRGRDRYRELLVELARKAVHEQRGHEHRAQHQHGSRSAPRRPRPSIGAPPRAGENPAAKFRSTFSTTTIASSTTMPMASTSPNSDRLLSEYPAIASTAKVPTSEIGIARTGMIEAPRLLQENDDHQHDQHDRLEQGVQDRVDRLRDELGRVVDDAVFEAAREGAGQLVHRRLHALCRREARWSRASGKPAESPNCRR